MKNSTIWISGKAMFKPDMYTFEDGFITYYIKDHKLYANVWKAFPESGQFKDIMYLHHTSIVFEHEDKSMKELIDG